MHVSIPPLSTQILPSFASLSAVVSVLKITTFPNGYEDSTIENHACLVVRVGASELGLAFPKDKLKQFAQWLAAAESLNS